MRPFQKSTSNTFSLSSLCPASATAASIPSLFSGRVLLEENSSWGSAELRVDCADKPATAMQVFRNLQRSNQLPLLLWDKENRNLSNLIPVFRSPYRRSSRVREEGGFISFGRFIALPYSLHSHQAASVLESRKRKVCKKQTRDKQETMTAIRVMITRPFSRLETNNATNPCDMLNHLSHRSVYLSCQSTMTKVWKSNVHSPFKWRHSQRIDVINLTT